MIADRLDAPASVHGNPLAGRHPALVGHSPKCGHESAPQACSYGIIKFVWQPDQVGVRIVNGHIVGKGAPVGKTWLELMIADLVISGSALRASPAAADKRNRDPVACFPSGYGLSNRYNIPG